MDVNRFLCRVQLELAFRRKSFPVVNSWRWIGVELKNFRPGVTDMSWRETSSMAHYCA